MSEEQVERVRVALADDADALIDFEALQVASVTRGEMLEHAEDVLREILTAEDARVLVKDYFAQKAMNDPLKQQPSA